MGNAQARFTIEKMQLSDIEPAIDVLQQSWLDTYVNEEHGIGRHWIEQRNKAMKSPEQVQRRRVMYAKDSTAGWVAKDSNGNIIGMTTPFVDEHGAQRVGSLYVAKEWRGRGVGAALMQKVIAWFDSAKPIELQVVIYNDRAKAFYKKWGFKEVPNSQTLFDGKLLQVNMVRAGNRKL